MRTVLFSFLISFAAYCGEWVIPWVTHNQQFDSTVILTNPTSKEVFSSLVAKRNGGQQYEAQVTLEPFGQQVIEIKSLFPNMEEGVGFAVFIESESERLLGSYMVLGKQSASGSSPSQGNIQPKGSAGKNLIFPFLPNPTRQISSPVVVNTSGEIANLVLNCYQGSVLFGKLEQTLEAGEPFAVVTNELFPGLTGPTYLWVSSDQPLVGSSFSFNDLLEPSISDAIVVEQAPDDTNQIESGVYTITLDSGIRVDSITMGFDNKIYIAEGWSGNRIFKTDQEGQIEIYSSGLRGPIDLDFDDFGNLIVTEAAGSLARISPGGTLDRFASVGQGPNGIAVGPDGNYYITYYGLNGSGKKIDRVTPQGEVSVFAEGGTIRTPIGVVFDEEGLLYCTNFEDGVVNVIDEKGHVRVLASIPQTLLGYIEVIGEYLFITSHTNNVLYKVNKKTGIWEIFAGSGASDVADGPFLQSSFAGTWGMAKSEDGNDLFITSYRDTVPGSILRRVRLK